MTRRQPLTVRVSKTFFRSWFWHPDTSQKNKKKGKRRSAKRERVRGKEEARDEQI